MLRLTGWHFRFFLAFLLLQPGFAKADDYNPGDPCAVSGAFHQTNDANGVEFLVCNGTTWQSSLYFKSGGGLSLGTSGGLALNSLTGQPAPLYGGSAAGADTQIQFNDGGSAFGGDAQFVWNKTSNKLTVTGDIDYTGVISDISDRRLKENIEPLADSLAKITALQGVSFTMRDNATGLRELGFIAQDVEPHFPTLVLERDGGLKSVNYLGLIAPMVEAIKAQQQMIDAQQAAIETLTEANDKLQARIQQVEESQGADQ